MDSNINQNTKTLLLISFVYNTYANAIRASLDGMMSCNCVL